MDPIKQKLAELNLVIAQINPAIASYVPVKKAGDMFFISGQLPIKDNKIAFRGKIGEELNLQQGQEAAQLCALNIFAQLYHAQYEPQNLRPIKLTVFVNSGAQFSDNHLVANGASELFMKLYGEDGRHARSAIGVSSLPLNAAVEVEAIFQQFVTK